MTIKNNEFRSDFENIINECCKKDKIDITQKPNGVCSQYEVDQMWKAFDLAVKIYKDKKRNTGGYYIKHYLDVARIAVKDIGLGPSSVICSLLHEILTEDNITIEFIRDEFGESISSIIEGMNVINTLQTEKVRGQAEIFRNLLFNLSKDVRVILIKIADRLGNMRNIENLAEKKQVQLALETSVLYTPLAHRLGLYNIKTELEDISFKYSNPVEYKEIEQQLQKSEKHRDVFIQKFLDPINQALQNSYQDIIGSERPKYIIKQRTKSVYSIWKKMQKQKIKFDQVYDVFAIRIIIDNKSQDEKDACWKVYSVVTNFYQPNIKRLRDWISIPKANGYESLHTTVMGLEGKWVEVQIRTLRMNEMAEKGMAAHWRYKEGNNGNDISNKTISNIQKNEIQESEQNTKRGKNKKENIPEDKLKTKIQTKDINQNVDDFLLDVRSVLEDSNVNAFEVIKDFKMDVYSSEIYIFTPKGDLKKLPKGSTVLDFAFSIHSEVGCKCVGAKINDKVASIKHELKSGNQVEIITNKKQKPSSDWLLFVKSSIAKNRIRKELKEMLLKDAEEGREIFERKFKNWKMNLSTEDINQLMIKYKYKNATEFYYDIATEKLDLIVLRDAIRKEENNDDEAEVVEEEITYVEAKEDGNTDCVYIDETLKNVDCKIAPCCNPVYGDSVFGFVTINDGIKIHRKNCPNAKDLYANYEYRIVDVQWKKTSNNTLFAVTLRIIGDDRLGITTDITNLITSELKLNMRSLNFENKGDLFEGNISILVKGSSHITGIIKALLKIKGVAKVSRLK